MVLTAVGTLEVGRNLPGRGAWLCRLSPSCLDLAARGHRFSRALRGKPASGAVEALRCALEEAKAPREAGAEVWEDGTPDRPSRRIPFEKEGP